MKPIFTIYDYLILSAVLIISVSIGLYHAAKRQFRSCKKKFTKEDNKTKIVEIKEYLIASSSMGAIPIAFSLLATHFSGNVLLGFPAEVYQYGIQFWVLVFGLMCTPIIGAFLTGPMFSRLKVISVFEYLKLRYKSNRIRLLGVWCYVLRIHLSTSMYIFGPATTLNALANISTPLSVIIIGAVATFYTAIGGIKAVIWTDFFQVIIMFFGMVIIISKGLYDVGGFSNLWSICQSGGRLNFFDFDLNPFIRQSFWSLTSGFFFQFLMQYGIDQQMVQRFSSAKTIRTAQIAVLLNVPGITILVTICCFTGLVLYANFSNCDPLSAPDDSGIKNANQVLPYFVVKNMHTITGTVGLFLSAILSGAFSSVSSTLNSLSAIIWEDLLKRFRFFESLNDSQSTLTTKFLVCICGIICTSIALCFVNSSSNIIQISGAINGALTAPIVGLFLLSSLFRISNEYGAAFGTLIGLAISLWLGFGSQIYQPKYPKLNVGTECYYNNTLFNSSLQTAHMYTTSYFKGASNLDGFNKVYSISYLYFAVIPTIFTVVCGLIISIFTGGLKNKVDDSLLLIRLKGSRVDKAEQSIELQEKYNNMYENDENSFIYKF